MQEEVVCHYHLKWVIWAWRGDLEASRLGRHLTYAGHAATSCLDDVWVDSGPEDRLVNPSSHT